MSLTNAEQQFLVRQRRGYLTTIGPDGWPQVKPLGFTWNAELGTIDIAGFNMTESAKYRNVATNPKVAFVVDEVTVENTMEGAHLLEIRGRAEQAGQLIRIHPTRVVAGNIVPGRPGIYTRNVAEARPDVAQDAPETQPDVA